MTPKKWMNPIRFSRAKFDFEITIGGASVPNTIWQYTVRHHGQEIVRRFMFLSTDCDVRIRLAEGLAKEDPRFFDVWNFAHMLKETNVLQDGWMVIVGFSYKSGAPEVRIVAAPQVSVEV